MDAQKSPLITEIELREALRSLLVKMHGVAAHVVEELNIENGASRIDMAVIAEKIVGYEIKSDFDSTARLYNQIHSYNRVFDDIYIVTSPVSAKMLSGLLPSWWGVLHGERGPGGVVYISEVRKPTPNQGRDPYSLLTLLKRDELNGLAVDRQLPKKIIKGNKPALMDTLADSIPLEEITNFVMASLRTRLSLSAA